MRCPGDYYPQWRRARLHAILDRYTPEFFRGKSLLEVGCGDGSIGNFFYYLGAEVTCADARGDYLKEIQWRNREINVVECDLNKHWPDPDTVYDIVLHMGVLFHLEQPEFSVVQACEHARHLILDCEVTNDQDMSVRLMPENPPTKYYENEGDDHAFESQGCRPTPMFIESVFKSCGMAYEMLNTDSYDYHDYPPKLGWSGETKGYTNGQRRMWFVRKS